MRILIHLQIWLTLAENFLDLQVWKVAYIEKMSGMTHISHAGLRVGAWAGNKNGTFMTTLKSRTVACLA